MTSLVRLIDLDRDTESLRDTALRVQLILKGIITRNLYDDNQIWDITWEWLQEIINLILRCDQFIRHVTTVEYTGLSDVRFYTPQGYLYLLILEVCKNAIHRWRADRIQIKITVDADMLCISISDNWEWFLNSLAIYEAGVSGGGSSWIWLAWADNIFKKFWWRIKHDWHGWLKSESRWTWARFDMYFPFVTKDSWAEEWCSQE